MTNQKLRQAWQAALDMEPIMKAVAGDAPSSIRMDASLAFVENTPWWVKQQLELGLERAQARTKAEACSRRRATGASRSASSPPQEYKWMYDFAL